MDRRGILIAILAAAGLVGLRYFIGRHFTQSAFRDHVFSNPLFSHAISEVGMTKLHMASFQGDSEGVRALIKQGDDVNIAASDGVTPLHLASLGGHSDVVEILLAAGANPNVQNERGDTPLAGAVFGGHPIVVEILLDNGALINIPNKQGITPLMVVDRWKQGMTEERRQQFARQTRSMEKCEAILRNHVQRQSQENH